VDDAQTRDKALAKLDKFTRRSAIRQVADYSQLVIEREDLSATFFGA